MLKTLYLISAKKLRDLGAGQGCGLSQFPPQTPLCPQRGSFAQRGRGPPQPTESPHSANCEISAEVIVLVFSQGQAHPPGMRPLPGGPTARLPGPLLILPSSVRSVAVAGGCQVMVSETVHSGCRLSSRCLEPPRVRGATSEPAGAPGSSRAVPHGATGHESSKAPEKLDF